MRPAPLVVGRRPPAPRAQEAAYLRWQRGVLAIWAHTARDLLDRSRTEIVTRADIVRAWEALISSANLGAVLVRISGELAKTQRSYFKRTLKAEPPAVDARFLRDAFVSENVELWRTLGEELADRLIVAFGQVRADAKRAPKRKPADVYHAKILEETSAARTENVALIKGIEAEQRAALEAVLSGAAAQGVRHETLIEQVQQITGYGESRSRLIARDQTVKHNAAVQEAQARAAGVLRYVWRTTRLENVRPMHKALEGKTFSYDNPPVTNKAGDRNNPGEDYQCACHAAPIIDLFAGLSDE